MHYSKLDCVGCLSYHRHRGVYDAGLSGGSEAVAYTALSGDTLTNIATNLTAAINANTNLQAINVSATSSGTVVFVKSSSINATTYAKSLSGGATETIALAPSTSANLYGYNNLNELTSIAAGGPTKFEGTANKASTSASVDSNLARLLDSLKFEASPALSNGENSVPVAVTDANSTTVTNNYKVTTNGIASAVPTFDANGNMTNDGVNTYLWDAEHRLVDIVYSGSGNHTLINYDARGLKCKLSEFSASVLIDTKLFVNAGSKICEVRDATNAVKNRFYSESQTINGLPGYYSFDQLGSIRELTDGTGTTIAQIDYSMWGLPIKTIDTSHADFQYAGYYVHSRSGLNFTIHRAYKSSLGRWLSREPRFKRKDSNLYCYVRNNPISYFDASGLSAEPGGNPLAPVIQTIQQVIGGAGGAPPPPPSDNDPPPPEPPAPVSTPLDLCLEDCNDWYCIDLDWIDKNIPEGNEKRKRLADAEQERDDCIEQCEKSFPTLWDIMIKTLTGK